MTDSDPSELRPRRGLRRLRWRLGTLVVAGGVVGYAAIGFYEVAPDEEAIVLRLGRYHRTLGPGLQWAPRFVDHVERRRVTVTIEEEFGYRTVSPGPPPEYEERPLEKRMLTSDENFVNVEFVVQYRIYSLEDYLLRLDDVPGVVRDVAESVVRQVVATHTIDGVLTEAKGPIEAESEAVMQELLDSYQAGVEIQNVLLQDVEAPEKVQDAFAEVVGAEQAREQTILEGQAYAEQVVPRARGAAQQTLNESEAYKQSRILEAEGEADRFLALLTEYRKAPAVTRERLYLEMLEVVLPRVEKVIIEQGQAERLLPYLPIPRGERRP
ncbi:MAG: FtsH protease activity modulator HflK [Myxococcota bacterium]